MKISEVAGVGKIVKGVNTTVDVKPGETKRQAAKFGNTIDAQGRPPELNKKARKNSDPNTLYNLGLVEKTIKQSHPLKVLDNIADRRDEKPFPIKMYDGSIIEVRPSTARRIVNIYLRSDEDQRKDMLNYLKTKNGLKELMRKVETLNIDDELLAEAWSSTYKRSIDCTNPKGFSQRAHCAGRKKNG